GVVIDMRRARWFVRGRGFGGGRGRGLARGPATFAFDPKVPRRPGPRKPPPAARTPCPSYHWLRFVAGDPDTASYAVMSDVRMAKERGRWGGGVGWARWGEAEAIRRGIFGDFGRENGRGARTAIGPTRAGRS